MMDLARFQNLLEAFGADMTRWPASERSAADLLLRGDEQARRLLSEFRALDAVLERAPVASDQSIARLTAGVMASIGRDPVAHPTAASLAEAQGNGRVVSLESVRRGRMQVHDQRPNRGWSLEGLWPAAALLAASLVVGVYLGATSFSDVFGQGYAIITGGEGVELQAVAGLGSDLATVLGEDAL